MNLLQRSRDLYAAFVNERNPNDPAVLNLRQWIVQTFQQEGLQMANEIDTARRSGNPVLPILQQGKTLPVVTSAPAYADGHGQRTQRQTVALKPFQHPGKSGKQPAVQVPLSGPIKPRTVRTAQQAQEQPPILETPPTTKEVSITPENGDQDVVGREILPFTKAEINEIAGMQPTGIIAKYDAARITAFLNSSNVPIPAGASHRQLAATMLAQIKNK
jgi:hypothetical protein